MDIINRLQAYRAELCDEIETEDINKVIVAIDNLIDLIVNLEE